MTKYIYYCLQCEQVETTEKWEAVCTHGHSMNNIGSYECVTQTVKTKK